MRRKRILLLCPYPEGVAPTQRFKYEPYLPILREQGYDVVVSPFMTPALWHIVYEPGHLAAKVAWSLVGYARRVVDLLRAPFFDGVYVSLHVTPLGTSLFERLCRLASRRLVYDVDDLVWLGRTSPWNRIIRPLKGRAKSLYLIRSADLVLACSPWLGEFARGLNPDTTEIPATVRTDVVRPRPSRPEEKKLVLGWTGSHTTSPYLELLERVLAELWTRHDFKLLVIGDRRFTMPGRDVEVLPWTPRTEVADLQRIDVGLYPLPDDPWIQGKSGLKAIQYMALGVPCVATAAGANLHVVEEGVTGFLVRTEREWVERLERLILDADLRRTMGARGRARAEERFSVEAMAPRYLGAFESAFGPATR